MKRSRNVRRAEPAKPIDPVVAKYRQEVENIKNPPKREMTSTDVRALARSGDRAALNALGFASVEAMINADIGIVIGMCAEANYTEAKTIEMLQRCGLYAKDAPKPAAKNVLSYQAIYSAINGDKAESASTPASAPRLSYSHIYASPQRSARQRGSVGRSAGSGSASARQLARGMERRSEASAAIDETQRAAGALDDDGQENAGANFARVERRAALTATATHRRERARRIGT